MSQIKSSLNNFNGLQLIQINKISSHLRMEFEKILNDIQHQLFFDENLDHQHLIFLLNNLDTIESELFHILNDSIHNLNIDDHIRDYLINNPHQLTSNLTEINIYSSINPRHINNYDFDDESDVDDQNKDIESDYYDDLENLVIDQLEIERNFATLPFIIQGNQHNNYSSN